MQLQKPTAIFSREEIASLSHRSDVRGAWLIVHCWSVIVGTWLVCIAFPNPVTILLGIAVIGTRQLGLGIISHDAAHHLLFRNRRLIDWAAEWLLSRPMLGGSILPYRKYHFVHHRFTQQENDPDLHLSRPFPVSRDSLRRKMIRDLTGQTGWKQRVGSIRTAFSTAGRPDLAKGIATLGPNFAINVVFLAFFTAMGAWYLYFLLWIVPYLTWNMLVTRIRNIGEHAAVPDNNDRLRNTRTTLAGPLARAFIAPYYVNYHLEHHLLVSAPCYNLKDVHRCLGKKGLLPQMEVKANYLEMLRTAAPDAA